MESFDRIATGEDDPIHHKREYENPSINHKPQAMTASSGNTMELSVYGFSIRFTGGKNVHFQVYYDNNLEDGQKLVDLE